MKFLLSIVLFGLLCIPSIAQSTSCDPVSNPGTVCSFDGTASIVSVDRTRMLIAIDTRNESVAEDGIIDHLFLYTAASVIEGLDMSIPFEAHIEFDGNILAIVPKHQDKRIEIVVRAEDQKLKGAAATLIRYGKGVGLSHYWGFDEEPRLDQLQYLEQRKCDSNPGSCYNLASYQITFPN